MQAGHVKLRTIETLDDIAEGLEYLTKADRRLKAVAKVAGALPLRRRAAGFGGLARIIVGQQLSVASANAIWAKFETAFPEMDANAVLRARVPRFRKAGMSAPKIKALRAIAGAVRNGLNLDALAHMPAEQAHARLTEIHGIGPWTADIYLLFCLGHPDIFPVGDLALRNAVGDAFGMEGPLAPAPLSEIAARWSPWRSVAATLFWAYYGARRAQKMMPV
ncbi:MAG TPA: DNA-3-methyladenine glycosylase 2 family protein [Bauldia sp.]|nr:DNA-3-methyladenine glycosylase 2 family protein [Bauldia sp.]